MSISASSSSHWKPTESLGFFLEGVRGCVEVFICRAWTQYSKHVYTSVHCGKHSTRDHTCTCVCIKTDTLHLYRLVVVDPQVYMWNTDQTLAPLCIPSGCCVMCCPPPTYPLHIPEDEGVCMHVRYSITAPSTFTLSALICIPLLWRSSSSVSLWLIGRRISFSMYLK